MPSIDDLPNEVLEQIMEHPDLEADDVMSAGQTCHRWFSLCKPIWQRRKAAEVSECWQRRDYTPSPAEVTCATLLAAHGHLSPQIITNKADKIQEKWSTEWYSPSPAEVTCASSLSAHGHLPSEVLQFKAEDLAEWFGRCYSTGPLLSQLGSAAALAAHGYLTHLNWLALVQVDLDSVAADDLASLVRCTKDRCIRIYRVTGDLTPLLRNVEGDNFAIHDMSLDTSNTESLVTAMLTRVDSIWLCKVNLDIKTLTQYDGKGKCREVCLYEYENYEEKYGNQVEAWRRKIGWTAQRKTDEFDSITMSIMRS